MENHAKEKQIRKLCGNKNPFKVPEGYFESFTDKMMEQLPLQDERHPIELKVTLWERVKPLLYLAAMFVGLMVCTRYILGKSEYEEKNTVNSYEVTISDQDIETIVNYTMMDDYTLYRYLTDAE